MGRTTDAEYSAILTALISFGHRDQIIKKAQELDNMFGGRPFEWILYSKYKDDIPNNDESFYRTVTNRRMLGWCHTLYAIAFDHCTIQNALIGAKRYGRNAKDLSYFEILKIGFGFREDSPAKRLALFMRWMVRDDGLVDMGLWDMMPKSELIIPLDTHVHQMALELGITSRRTHDLRAATEITDYFKQLFPDDPCLGDFALFGYGMNRLQNNTDKPCTD